MVACTHLLDTNVFIQLLRGNGDSILEHLKTHPPGSLALSTLSLAELSFGAARAQKPQETERVARLTHDFLKIPFTEDASWHYGTLRAHLHKQGTPIGHMDLLIAATALSENLCVVTHNLREFQRVPGLRCEDWQ